MNTNKVYVDVTAVFSKEGQLKLRMTELLLCRDMKT